MEHVFKYALAFSAHLRFQVRSSLVKVSAGMNLLRATVLNLSSLTQLLLITFGMLDASLVVG